MSNSPTTQRAWVYRATGQPAEVLKLEESHPLPVPKKDELLIKVKATDLNPISWKLMQDFPFSLLQKKPCTPELDFSGEVVGGKVEGTEFKIGDAVFGTIDPEVVMKTGNGTLAQYCVASPVAIGKKPENMSWQDAASLPVVMLTAYHNLVTNGGLVKGKEGQRVFINGGSGGVGTLTIQLAKIYGAYVVTTASPASTELVRSLGADEIIDYRSVTLPTYLSKNFGGDKMFDIVVDTQGDTKLYGASGGFLKPTSTYLDISGPHLDSAFSAVKAIGTTLSRATKPMLCDATRRYKFTRVGTEKEEFGGTHALVLEGKLKPVVDKVFKFEDALKAYEYGMSGRAKGKIVIEVDC